MKAPAETALDGMDSLLLTRRHERRAMKFASIRSPAVSSAEAESLEALEARLGRLYVRQRLGIEQDYESYVFRRNTQLFHLENWYSIRGLIRCALLASGLLGRGRRNARAIQLRVNEVHLPALPPAFDGFTMLQLSDLHIDMSEEFLDGLLALLPGLKYDICVLTGDYRARTFGTFDASLAGMHRLRSHIGTAAYGILGNHDSLRMVPALETIGYRMLVNEYVRLQRGGETIYLAGIDDAHFYRLENFHRAADEIPQCAVGILLSHTPEAYRHAAHAGFSLMLSGHTHGGQICFPGGTPVLTEAGSPRRFARGAWRYLDMLGYTSAGVGTSIIDVRLNCPPEVTLHQLRRA